MSSQCMEMYSRYSWLTSRSRKWTFCACGSGDANWLYLAWEQGGGNQRALSVKGPLVRTWGFVSPRVSVMKTQLCGRGASAAVDTPTVEGVVSCPCETYPEERVAGLDRL